mmetsp:Transcript_119428/g.372039  ORF Transcript_119428/g.372039 Transcript_119428/m.372039 type:complete len:231 (+) Transcript_119428:202-894(+)
MCSMHPHITPADNCDHHTGFIMQHAIHVISRAFSLSCGKVTQALLGSPRHGSRRNRRIMGIPSLTTFRSRHNICNPPILWTQASASNIPQRPVPKLPGVRGGRRPRVYIPASQTQRGYAWSSAPPFRHHPSCSRLLSWPLRGRQKPLSMRSGTDQPWPFRTASSFHTRRRRRSISHLRRPPCIDRPALPKSSKAQAHHRPFFEHSCLGRLQNILPPHGSSRALQASAWCP